MTPTGGRWSVRRASTWPPRGRRAPRRWRHGGDRCGCGASPTRRLPVLRIRLGTRLTVGARPGGRVEVEVAGPSVGLLVSELAGFGSRLLLLDPPEARERTGGVGRGPRAGLYGGRDGGTRRLRPGVASSRGAASASQARKSVDRHRPGDGVALRDVAAQVAPARRRSRRPPRPRPPGVSPRSWASATVCRRSRPPGGRGRRRRSGCGRA